MRNLYQAFTEITSLMTINSNRLLTQPLRRLWTNQIESVQKIPFTWREGNILWLINSLFFDGARSGRESWGGPQLVLPTAIVIEYAASVSGQVPPLSSHFFLNGFCWPTRMISAAWVGNSHHVYAWVFHSQRGAKSNAERERDWLYGGSHRYRGRSPLRLLDGIRQTRCRRRRRHWGACVREYLCDKSSSGSTAAPQYPTSDHEPHPTSTAVRDLQFYFCCQQKLIARASPFVESLCISFLFILLFLRFFVGFGSHISCWLLSALSKHHLGLEIVCPRFKRSEKQPKYSNKYSRSEVHRIRGANCLLADAKIYCETARH